uniref:Uncharacterized protein n=1 Tax=Anguilla anguilla TaxID=7936 RepID=A0A0E9WNI9_ANGAN
MQPQLIPTMTLMERHTTWATRTLVEVCDIPPLSHSLSVKFHVCTMNFRL